MQPLLIVTILIKFIETMRFSNKYNNNFHLLLNGIDWNPFYKVSDINLAVAKFYELFNSCFNKFIADVSKK